MSPFFSVIIPIYNVSRFIDSGIQYVLNQSYPDFEVLLIDDGSTDDSGEKCERLAAVHQQVRCFHQSNSGSGPARNLGIQNARGEYIVFFDIDDKIDETFLETVFGELKNRNQPDVLMFSYDSYDVRYKTLTPVIFKDVDCKSNEEIRTIYVDQLLGLEHANGFVWNKVYHRCLLADNAITFPRLLIQQDEVFNLYVYRKATSLVISPKVLYHYVVYDKGNTRSRYIPERFHIYNTVKKEFLKLYQEWNLDDERMLKYVYGRFFRNIILTLNFSKKVSKREFKRIVESEDTISCVKALKSLNDCPDVFCGRQYLSAIEKQDFVKYRLIRFMDHFVKNLKWTVKKHFI